MSLALFVPLTKVDAVNRLVYGSLATEAPDRTKEVFDYESSKPFVEKWSGGIAKATDGKSQGNLRAMHGKVAAGKFTEVTCNDAEKRVDVCAKVVDDAEWTKVQEGVYTGFSIGGSYVKKWKDGEFTRYTADPNEGSLVDLPCNPEAQFVMIKDGGTTEMRKFVQPTASPELEQVWKAKDGKTFTKKSDAESHNAALSDPASKLTAAVTELTAAVTKAENAYGNAEASTEAEEEVLELKDIADLPEVIRAAMADSDTAEVFRRAYNKARASGMGAVEAIDDAWGKVVNGSEKTADGKYKITGTLLPFEESSGVPAYGKSAGLGAGAAARLAGTLDRNAKTGVAKRDFTPAERDKAADTGAALPDGSFPIKSKNDLGNAIKAFGRAKNKSAVKAHIKTRAKALGAEDQLPDSWKPGADKATVTGALRKGLYAVSRLASLIEELEWFQQSEEMEAAREGDGSENPDKAKQLVASACALLRSIVEEETNEMLDGEEMLEYGEMLEMASHVRGASALAKVLGDKAPKVLQEVRKASAKAAADHITAAHAGLAAAGANCPNAPAPVAKPDAEKVAKAGARHNAGDQTHLDSAHDHLDKMGYCGEGAAEKMAKGMSKEDSVHLDSAHDHVSKMGIGCGMSKAGARHSAADAALLTDAHDHMAKAGATCPAYEAATATAMPGNDGKQEKGATAADLTKSLADKDAVIARLEKTTNDATAAVQQLLERVTKIEAQAVPDPAQRTYRIVSKADDDAREAVARLEKLKREDPRAFAMALISDAQAHPIDLNQVGSK